MACLRRRLLLHLCLLPGVSFILGCCEKLVPGRGGVMVKGQKSGEAGIPRSGKVLRHCFWTCSFSESPPDSHHSQAGEDRGQGLFVHRAVLGGAHGNLPVCGNRSARREPSSHSNFAEGRNLSSRSNFSSCRGLPTSDTPGLRLNRGHQPWSQQQ